MNAIAYNRVELAIRYLAEQSPNNPSLEQIAAQVNLSPFQFQREFSAWAGLSPSRFARVLSRNQLRQRLDSATPLDTVAGEAGLSSVSRLHDLFVTLDAMTPAEVRSGGAGLSINYAVAETAFGQALVAATGRGICSLQFIEAGGQAQALARVARSFPSAALLHDPGALAPVLAALSGDGRESQQLLRVRGTNFQVQVWQALLKIGEGQVTTYQRIAEYIGRPTAVRAVGNAVGANPVAWLIPCHRVIRASGALGGYHWGLPRKMALLGREASVADEKSDPDRL